MLTLLSEGLACISAFNPVSGPHGFGFDRLLDHETGPAELV